MAAVLAKYPLQFFGGFTKNQSQTHKKMVECRQLTKRISVTLSKL